jgi:hypothetical protein
MKTKKSKCKCMMPDFSKPQGIPEGNIWSIAHAFLVRPLAPRLKEDRMVEE